MPPSWTYPAAGSGRAARIQRRDGGAAPTTQDDAGGVHHLHRLKRAIPCRHRGPIPQPDLAALRESNDGMEALLQQRKMTLEVFTTYIDLNARFHAAIVDLSRSRI